MQSAWSTKKKKRTTSITSQQLSSFMLSLQLTFRFFTPVLRNTFPAPKRSGQRSDHWQEPPKGLQSVTKTNKRKLCLHTYSIWPVVWKWWLWPGRQAVWNFFEVKLKDYVARIRTGWPRKTCFYDGLFSCGLLLVFMYMSHIYTCLSFNKIVFAAVEIYTRLLLSVVVHWISCMCSACLCWHILLQFFVCFRCCDASIHMTSTRKKEAETHPPLLW